MAGIVLLLIKWVLITALLLAVPFGVWWVVDRSRRTAAGRAAAGPAVAALADPLPAPPIRPARIRASAPAPTLVRAPTPIRPADPPTAPVPVPRRASRPLTVVPSPRGTGQRPAALLAADRSVVLTREEDHQDVLAAHHSPGRPPTPVVVELWSSAVTRGKYRGDYAVEVRLGGRRVGELTAAMSTRYRRLVEVADPVRCRGVVTYGPRGFQVDLRLPDVV